MIKRSTLFIVIVTGIVVLVVFVFVMRKKDVSVVPTNSGQASTSAVLGSTTSVAGVPVAKKNTLSIVGKTAPVQPVAVPSTTKYVVTYTDKGFSPKTIQVPRGNVVKFINNSNSALLIVADDQNSQLLNEINQPKAVNKGGVYTFDFAYVAVWAYHNATQPDHHGNIVVY